MAQVLTDLSLERLAAANEANWRAGFCLMLARWERGEVHVEPQAIWYRSEVAHPLLNGVLTCRFAPHEVEAQVARMIDRFRERDLPFWWWTFPSSAPANLGEVLEHQGLVREDDLPGMGVDLSILPEVAIPPGVTVERVRNPQAMAQWAEAYGTGFPQTRPVAEAHLEIFARLGFDGESGWHHYVALEGDRPVACSSLYLGAGVAGLCYVATVPDRRGRGIGRAMVLTPLLEARRLGYRAGILQATAAGRPLYRRLGFRDCVAFPQYRWRG